MEMETTPAPAPVSAEPARVGALGRMIGALFNPVETFADIARAPSFLAPMALFVVLGIAFAWMMNQRVDWPNFIRSQAERSPRFAQLSEEQKQQAIGPQTRFAPMFAYAIGALGSPLSILILSAVYLLAFNVMAGAGVRFKQAFGIVTHALMPSSIASMLGLITMSFKKFGDVDPERLLASSVSAFLDNEAPRWLLSLGGSLELFWLWALCLLGMGFAAANPKKISTGKGIGIAVGVWAVYVAIKVGLAAAFS